MSIGSMLKFWSAKQDMSAVPFSVDMRRKLAADCGLNETTAATLAMVTEPGRYADRIVTYFRVFDPAAVKAAGVQVGRYSDLSAHRDLHMFYGNIERDGHIQITRQP